MWRLEIRRDSITQCHVCHLAPDQENLCVLLCGTLCLCGFSVAHEAYAATRIVIEDVYENGAQGAPVNYMAGPTRLELATSGVTGLRSNQLNYDPAFMSARVGGRWGTRTLDLRRDRPAF